MERADEQIIPPTMNPMRKDGLKPLALAMRVVVVVIGTGAAGNGRVDI